MLDQDQIQIVRKMCRVPASGSPIMIGIWAVDTNRNIDAIVGDIKHERYGARATDAIKDKSIAVITDFWPEHEDYWMDMVGKYRFRNQLIFMLDPSRKYSPQWLSRLAIINPVAEPVCPAAWRKHLRTFTTINTNHRDARKFIEDVEVKYDLRAVESGDGLKHVVFHKADGTIDDRFDVALLYNDGAMINMMLGEI